MENEAFDLLVENLEKIPTIGKKSASKIAYTLALENKVLALSIAHCIENAVLNVQKCESCGGISEKPLCAICSDEARIKSAKMCIVASPKDILTIENIHFFKGVYCVIDNIKTTDFARLKARISECGIKEIIFAFSPSVSNETFMLFIEDKLKDKDLIFSKIAQGVPTGVGLENIDSLSLEKAIEQRTEI